MNTQKIWPKSHDSIVVRHYGDMPAREIAAILNNKFGTKHTKNSVIGRAQRMGLGGKIVPKVAVVAARPPIEKKPKAKPKPIVETGGVPFATLDRGMCYFPIGDLFCGKACKGNYCDAHKERMKRKGRY